MKYASLFTLFAALFLSGIAIAQAQSTGGNMTVAVTVVYPPTPPTNLVATTTSPSEIDLSWADNSNNEDGFVIEESVGNNSLFTPIDTVGPNVASYARTGLLPNTAYYYRVAAFNGAGYGIFTNEASSTTASLPSGACTPSNVQSCTSAANSCGMTNTGTQTCLGTYTWGTCSATTPSNSACTTGSTGGGGGGGGFSVLPPPAPIQANVTISGAAYPLSTVTILEDSSVAVKTIAGPDGNFSATINALAAGSYTFSVYANDSNGNRSSLFSFPVTLAAGAATEITGVFLSPTISVDKSQVKQGDPLVIFGQSTPNATVMISVHSSQLISATAVADKNGAYVYDLDTNPLEFGSHVATARSQLANLISNNSMSAGFAVGDTNIARSTSTPATLVADLNGDDRVNLVDFSILAYWYNRPGFPTAYDLNGDGKISLIDFSIMAYYWTG